MATDIWAAADADTITDGAEAAVIITDGTEDAATTSIAGKPSLDSLIVIALPRAKRELQRRERVAPSRRGRFSERRPAGLPSPAPSPPRSGSRRNASLRRASC